jgi:hypothetical protein
MPRLARRYRRSAKYQTLADLIDSCLSIAATFRDDGRSHQERAHRAMKGALSPHSPTLATATPYLRTATYAIDPSTEHGLARRDIRCRLSIAELWSSADMSRLPCPAASNTKCLHTAAVLARVAECPAVSHSQIGRLPTTEDGGNRMTRYRATERIGINAVEGLILDLGWIFREQPIVDMGIDAQVERADDGHPTGKLIALQIKTGPSHFRETEDALVYYGDDVHLEYWMSHALPVVLVAHLPDTGLTVWTEVSASTVARTRKGWKIEIPKTAKLDRRALTALMKLTEGTTSEQQERKLAMDEPLIRHIASGGRVTVELEHWVNKSLGRTPIEVFVHDDSDERTLSREWAVMYVGLSIKQLVEELFPWAKVSTDCEFYDEHVETDPYDDFMAANDADNGYPHSDERDDIRPYSEAAGEVESYRLELSLNDVGRAFLTLSDHASKPLIRSFPDD